MNAVGKVGMDDRFDSPARKNALLQRPVSAGPGVFHGTGTAAHQQQLRADASQSVLPSKKKSRHTNNNFFSASDLYFPIVNGGLGATDTAIKAQAVATRSNSTDEAKATKKHHKRSKSKNQAITPRGRENSLDSKNKTKRRAAIPVPTRRPSTISRSKVQHEDQSDRHQKAKSRAGSKAIPGVPDQATLEARRRARSEIKARERQKSERRQAAAEKRVAERRKRRNKRIEREMRRAQANALARKELAEQRIQEKLAASAALEEARETKSGVHFIHFIDRQSRKAAAAAAQKVERERRSAAAVAIQCAVRAARAQRQADAKRQAILLRKREHQAEIERQTAKAEAMRLAELRRERGKEVKLVQVRWIEIYGHLSPFACVLVCVRQIHAFEGSFLLHAFAETIVLRSSFACKRPSCELKKTGRPRNKPFLTGSRLKKLK